MKKLIIFVFITLFNSFVYAEDITVIQLHKSIDRILEENLQENEDIIIDEKSEINIDDLNENDLNDQNEEIISIENNEETNQLEKEQTDLVVELPDLWDSSKSEDLIFLLENIQHINSEVLKNELIKILDIRNLPSSDLENEDFQKVIIDSLLVLGDRKKSYEIIRGFQKVENPEYNFFYRQFELNYLLSVYNLSEACDYKNEIKNFKLKDEENYLLKIDILCLVLEEKFDQANLLNSLLNESKTEQDQYFQYLFEKLLEPELKDDDTIHQIKEKNIFLYSAMHRVGNIPLNEKFLFLDPINTAMPIILSSSTDIKLRLKAAHLAYLNNLINIDSLAALYQAVDFSYDELNDPSSILPSFDQNTEIGMAYYYQLINIQLLPLTRLEAIIEFWKFAKQNNLEKIAYQLSIKNLNTIDPSNELSKYGPEISKAYIYNLDFQLAEKWLLFSENSNEEESNLREFNSSKLLYSLYNISESENIIDVLYKNLQFMSKNLTNENNKNFASQNDILHSIYSILDYSNQNPFKIEKKLQESRLMPSKYIINQIKKSIEDKNYPELLISIIASMNGNLWQDIHPEHLNLILIGLAEYKQGLILNEILLEILQQSKII